MSKVQQLHQHPPSIAAIRLRAQKNYYSSQISLPENGNDNSGNSKSSANKTRDDSIPSLNHSRDEVEI